jgi:superoxide dismutase, Cu-Zn family
MARRAPKVYKARHRTLAVTEFAMPNAAAPITAAALALLAIGPAAAAPGKPAASTHHVAMIGTNGQAMGMAMLEQTPVGVLITLELSGLTPGEHGFHVHEKGTCDPASGFASAGGHFAPGRKIHGFRDAKGPHSGDMANLFSAADGTVRAQVLNAAVTLGTGKHSLFDADGSALVVHAGPDDYASQPAGASGGRIACGVIAAPR